MNVVAVDIRAPGDDVTRMRELLRIGAHLDADNGLQPRLARRRANVAGQLRSPQAMKKSPVHGSAIERTQRAPIRVRQDGLTAEIRNDLPEPRRNFVEGLVPSDALMEGTVWGRADPSPGRPLPRPFGRTRRMGYSTRSGEYTRSRYFATLAHKKPRVTGCAGSP